MSGFEGAVVFEGRLRQKSGWVVTGIFQVACCAVNSVKGAGDSFCPDWAAARVNGRITLRVLALHIILLRLAVFVVALLLLLRRMSSDGCCMESD